MSDAIVEQLHTVFRVKCESRRQNSLVKTADNVSDVSGTLVHLSDSAADVSFIDGDISDNDNDSSDSRKLMREDSIRPAALQL